MPSRASAPLPRCVNSASSDTVQAQLTVEEYRAAFSALAQLESLHLRWICGVDRLLPHVAHAPALRSIVITCGAQSPTTVERYGSAVPSRELLRQLLTASPRLEVRLEAGASIETWRHTCYDPNITALQREQLDEQWRELQRMGAEMERVTVVDADLTRL